MSPRVPPTGPAPGTPAPLLTLKEVAHELTVSPRQVQSWRASGRLHVLVFGTHCVRVERAELDRFKREARS